jgi:hypothetical protein
MTESKKIESKKTVDYTIRELTRCYSGFVGNLRFLRGKMDCGEINEKKYVREVKKLLKSFKSDIDAIIK